MTDLYTGLTEDHFNRAFEILTSAAKVAHEQGVTNRFAGTLVILRPHVRPSSDNPGNVSLDEVLNKAVACAWSLDSNYREIRDDGSYLTADDFFEIALTKARDLWVLGPRMGMSYFTSRELVNQHPELLVPGMTRYVGGVWNCGRVTTFSGVQGDCDIAFSVTVDAWVAAQARLAAIPLVSPDNPDAIIGGQSARDIMFQ